MLVLVNLSKGVVVCKQVEIADTFLKRALGLMFRFSYDGCLLFPTKGKTSFHTFFCRFPILFLCVKEGKVTCKRVVEPWSVVTLEGDIIIEMDGRRECPVEVGDEVAIQ